MKDKQLSDSFIEMKKSLIKKFFIFQGKEDFVKDIKVKIPKKKLKSTDILVPKDIDLLIETDDNNRDKAFVALTFECGGRISEILRLKVKDILLKRCDKMQPEDFARHLDNVNRIFGTNFKVDEFIPDCKDR